MTHTLRSFLLLLSTLGSTAALAQTPTLEFAAGAGNPTVNGPSVADQVITFQNNATNPTDNTMAAYAPAVTTTFSLSNQQYTLPTNRISTGTGVAFGGGLTTTSGTVPALALFPLLNAIGSSSNGNYTSASGVTGGIDVAANSGTELLTSVEALPATIAANTARYQVADLKVTFSRALVNPVLHFTGLGGSFSTGGNKTGFTTELDLQSTGVTLSKLSGSTELTVNSTQVLNNATAPDGATGSGAASGSVLVTTSTAGVTELIFRLYLRVAAAGGTIHGANANTFIGDGWIISVSERTASATTVTPLPVQLAAFAAQAVAGHDAQLSWTTASELHNAYFDVERSLDGSTFTKIGQLAGQGSKATSTTYGYLDAGIGQRVSGLVYYRLRQVDTDGSSSYSPVRAVSFGSGAPVAAKVSLYPNPAQASASLDLSALPTSATYQVQVLGATGARLQALQVAGGQAQPLDLASLAPGLYTVLITGPQTDGRAFRQVIRLNKQ